MLHGPVKILLILCLAAGGPLILIGGIMGGALFVSGIVLLSLSALVGLLQAFFDVRRTRREQREHSGDAQKDLFALFDSVFREFEKDIPGVPKSGFCRPEPPKPPDVAP